MTVAFLNPTAECLVEAIPYNLQADLQGEKTIGLVINMIVDCDRFMLEVGEALKALNPALTVIAYETGTVTFADASLMDRVARECDAAICAIGHCGSCTAGTVKDSIALIERGCPAVSLVTEVFWQQATALSRSLAWPDAPRVKLPYPVWGTDQSSMREIAQRAARDILKTFESVDAETA